MSAINVLVYPSGTEIGLEIGRSLQYSRHFNVIGLNSIPDHSDIVFKNVIYNAPNVYEKEMLIKLLHNIVMEKNIKIIFPAHDEVIYLFSKIKIQNVIFITPIKFLAQVLRYKEFVYRYLEGSDYLPKIFKKSDIKNLDLPLFLRPNRGQGSQGAVKIEKLIELADIDSDAVITEYLPGEEYTVDCFTNSQGELLFFSSRKRERIRSGISVRVVEVDREEFRGIATDINKKLSPRGAWFFQCKRNEGGELKLLEISNRIAGSMGYQRMKGINLVLLTLFDALNYPVSVPDTSHFPLFVYERALSHKIKINEKIHAAYVDFDDTLMMKNNQIHYELVGLLYGLKLNKKIKIILISKHHGDLILFLESLKLSFLFDEIIHIKSHQNKYDFIGEKNFIFIDDSFSERIQMQTKFPLSLCFGPESLEYVEGMLRSDSVGVG